MKCHKDLTRNRGDKKGRIGNSFQILHSWVNLLDSHWFKKLGHSIKHQGILLAKESEELFPIFTFALPGNIAWKMLSRIRLERTGGKTISPCKSKSRPTLLYHAKCKKILKQRKCGKNQPWNILSPNTVWSAVESWQANQVSCSRSYPKA